MNQPNIEIEILINIIPIIIINSVIAIITILIMSFIILSIQNKFLNIENISNVKKKMIHFASGIIIIIFLTINQVIFSTLFNIPEINNINGLIGVDVFKTRDSFFSTSMFLIQLFFILVFTLKTSIFNSFIAFLFIIPLQYMIPVVDKEIIGLVSNITKISLFLAISTPFLFIGRFFYYKQKTSIIVLMSFLIIAIFFASGVIVDLSFSRITTNLLIFLAILIFGEIYFLIAYVLVDNIIISISRVNFLNKSTIFDDEVFVKNSLSETYFKNWVTSNKIDAGIFLLFKFSNEGVAQKFLGRKGTKIIHNRVVELIIASFKKDFIYLKGINGDLYFFTKISNIEKINVKINALFKILPNKVILRDQKVLLLFKFYGVQYGKSASNFDGLIDCLNEVSKNKGVNDKEHLIMYHFLKRDLSIKNNDFAKLNQKIKISSITIKLFNMGKHWESKVLINGKIVEDVNEILSEINDLKIKELLVRYIAYLALEKFYFEKGIIHLPFLASIIESKNFNLKDFFMTINNIGVKYSNIKLVLLDKVINKNNPNYKNIISSRIII